MKRIIINFPGRTAPHGGVAPFLDNVGLRRKPSFLATRPGPRQLKKYFSTDADKPIF